MKIMLGQSSRYASRWVVFQMVANARDANGLMGALISFEFIDMENTGFKRAPGCWETSRQDSETKSIVRRTHRGRNYSCVRSTADALIGWKWNQGTKS